MGLSGHLSDRLSNRLSNHTSSYAHMYGVITLENNRIRLAGGVSRQIVGDSSSVFCFLVFSSKHGLR